MLAAVLINCDAVGMSFFPRVSASICKMDVTPTFESWVWKLEIKDEPLKVHNYSFKAHTVKVSIFLLSTDFLFNHFSLRRYTHK